MLVFDLNNVANVKNKKGYERSIISVFKENGVDYVKYIVKSHKDKYRINSIQTIKRKSFVDWLDGIQINNDKFQRGDILQFGDFKLVVLKNKGVYGNVRDFHKGYIIEKFYWRGYSDLRCYKTGWIDPKKQSF